MANNNDNNEEPESLKKQINITGTNNRYMIKKVIKEPKKIKKRQEIEKLELSEDYFSFEKQYKLLEDLIENINDESKKNNDLRLVTSNVERKITSYRQQDILKKIYNESEFIDFKSIIHTMLDCKLDCYYCKNKMLLLYEIVRENKQWTVDRINNDIGHNKNNYILACLECNLKRRRKDCDKFLFTKQLNIIKRENLNEETE